MRTLLLTIVGALAIAALPARADVRISDRPYVRHDGGTDVTIADCSNDASTPTQGGDGAGNLMQNEPTVAMDPRYPQHVVAGANDYCPLTTVGDVWAGFYYSADRGATWVNSLLPGYSTDTSNAAQASPLHGLVTAASDPSQAWDLQHNLYYGGIAFNRARPGDWSIWAARYSWPPTATSPTYEFTTMVARGTPTPGVGHLEDKATLEVDRGVDSPHQGNVYLCWTRFTGGPSNFVYFARSTDGARSFTTELLSESRHVNQGCDIAVTRNGTVFVAWRQYDFEPPLETPQKQNDAVVFVKSTDGGASFTQAAVAFEFLRWEPLDRKLTGARARECGDGPQACVSGYVFGRVLSWPRIAADPVAGDGDDAYVVVGASVPGSQVPTTTTYGTLDFGVGTQGSIYFSKTTDGGATWSAPVQLDPQAVGHQLVPDIDIDDGYMVVVYHDGRNDNASGPAGGGYRTVPFGNVFVGPPAASVAGVGLETWYSSSTDGGATWSHAMASQASSLQNVEVAFGLDAPFFGDYNSVDVVGSNVIMAWTDSRDTVPGTDLRYDIPSVYPDDGQDGFDALSCMVLVPNGFRVNCHNAGGFNQNVFGLVLP
jgi:hypothetical protein